MASMVEWSSDVTAAEWIAARLHGFATDVGSLVPAGFPAYARLLHPAARAGGGTVRWSELAAAQGRELGAATQFEELAAPGTEPPVRGALDADGLRALVGLLAERTTTPGECWFAIWDGYAWLEGPPATAALPEAGTRPGVRDRLSAIARRHLRRRPVGARLELPGRSYLLHRAPLEAASGLGEALDGEGPSLWWPADRAWCVASDVDLDSTYVGGSEELVARMRADERLEAVPVALGDRINR